MKQNRAIVLLNYVVFHVTNKIERKILTSTQIIIEIVTLFDE
jgi:hypothetical protein